MKIKLVVTKTVLPYLIIAAAAFLRIWRLDKVPLELFGDEIDAGIQAYSILKTGKDIFSNQYPVIFHSFSEYRLPLQIYSMVGTIGLFGLTEMGVRLASVTFGILSVVGIYFLVKELINQKIAFITALFLSISPWHLQFSRQANDSGFILPFVIFGLWLFIKGLRKYRYMLISSVLFSLSFYAYATSVLFTPFLVLFLLFIYRRTFIKYGIKKIALLGVVTFLVLTPYLSASIKGSTTGRFSYISVFNDENIKKDSTGKLLISTSPISRLFYNNKSLVLSKIFTNYLSSYSTNFLLTLGDPDLRNSVGAMGEVYYFDLVFIIIGIFYLLTKYYGKNKKIMIMFIWLLISPVPSSLTSDGGSHSGRLILMLPPLMIFSAVGFYRLIYRSGKILNKLALAGIIFTMLINIIYYFNQYYVIWPRESWRFWQVGYKEMFSYVKSIEGDFERVYFNNTYEPALPRFLFWYRYDPQLFHQEFKDDKHIPDIVAGFNGFRLGDKYYFGQIQKPVENLAKEGSLIVASARDDITNPKIFENPNLKLLEVFYSPTGTPIFYVFTGVNVDQPINEK
ncbi:hypothetical protein A3A52_03595 [Candidatus Woesebacteria bacterium RIFCSPLOWO2_01_FULL_39_14]|uniref:Glycosyltransferase RgtA/B/C/D-like domain-containing protein n=1 Tax=Candidatus Woesebacteria bacterium RIFCSPLOWO2_01_FULL_39_14 TaxID=1802518 RepID=A0A1F8BEG6_9BACT|nr:MAG: hypothetical protein A3A52_03595 [Candidatus Woesebacteria bacterium RIFCSPLOWO2_01_FULL_39_14]